MRERKIRLYVQDAEYGSRLSRFLAGRDRVGLRVERMTEREEFWRSREWGSVDEGIVWLTDDVTGMKEDPGKGEAIFLLDGGPPTKSGVAFPNETSDRKAVQPGVMRRISYLQTGERIYCELLAAMGLAESAPVGEAPPPGLYGVFSPWGEEAQVTGALLSQELAAYGKCLYVNTGSFPMWYRDNQRFPEGRYLSELLFRMEREDFPELVRNMEQDFGVARRLPSVAHYRDLWDVKEEELRLFFERLCTECDSVYVVAVFSDVREALPMADCCRRFFFSHRRSGYKPMEEWRRYAKNENREADRVTEIVMPAGWERWCEELETSEVSDWLSDRKKKSFVGGLWKEERDEG